MSLTATTVQVGTNTVPWTSVLQVLWDPAVRTLPPPHRACWLNGEEWAGEIVAVSGNRITFRFDLFGVRETAGANLSLLDFSPDLPAQAARASGAAYLRDGDPLPATLVWIDPQQMALDSPLGVLTIPRERVLRYVYPSAPRHYNGQALGDEVRLVDGTLLRGLLRVETNEVRLRHGLLGELRIPLGALRSIARSSPDIWRLADLVPVSVNSAGVFGETTASGGIQVRRHDLETGRARFLTTLVLFPKTTLLYRLDGRLASGADFHAWLKPVEGARGPARIVVFAGNRQLLERMVEPAEPVIPVVLPVPSAREFSIQVDFGDRVGFPCGVCLADAFFATRMSEANP